MPALKSSGGKMPILQSQIVGSRYLGLRRNREKQTPPSVNLLPHFSTMPRQTLTLQPIVFFRPSFWIFWSNFMETIRSRFGGKDLHISLSDSPTFSILRFRKEMSIDRVFCPKPRNGDYTKKRRHIKIKPRNCATLCPRLFLNRNLPVAVQG